MKKRIQTFLVLMIFDFLGIPLHGDGQRSTTIPQNFPKVHTIFFKIQEDTQANASSRLIGDLYKELMKAGIPQTQENAQQKESMAFKSLSQNWNQAFILNQAGQIYTNGTIDREVLCPHQKICNQTFSILVSLSTQEPIAIFDVNIIVEDVADCFPTWNSPQTSIEIMESVENGSAIFISRVVDMDSPYVNGKFDEARQPEIKFEIRDPTKTFGVITKEDTFGKELSKTELFVYIVILKQLDRESIEFYYPILCMKVPEIENRRNQDFSGWNHDRMTSQYVNCLSINITVLDANDEVPQFLEGKFNRTMWIPENIPVNSTILNVSAYDKDIGKNAELIYGFAQLTGKTERELFWVEPKTGFIYLKNELDYERQTSHRLYLSVQDSGENPKSATIDIFLNVCRNKFNSTFR